MSGPALDRLTAALADRYTIERELGAGGMATVYLAEDLRHHRQVALKVLRPEIAATLGAGRFAREIEVAARLQHPNILPLLDSGEAAGFFFYVMPFVEGESLRDRLARGGELPIHDAVRILMEVADALSHAHAHGVVHRDIKPDNVMLSGRHALVADFGVAKAVTEATGRQVLTSAGVALGTPAYMAPEQAVADPHQDHRVDIYALGVLAYELLTGRAPFSATTAQEMLAAHITAVPEPLEQYRPTVSPALAAVVMKCLAKKPADRWQTADELLAQLEPLATPSGGTTPTQARPATALARMPRSTKWAAGVAAAVAVVGLGLGVLRLARSTRPPLVVGRSEQLTAEPGLEIQPAISPDGKLVAYAAGSSGRMRILIRPVGGGRTIPLLDDSAAVETEPRWSPDGSAILFLTRGGASVAPALGGSSRPIVPPSVNRSVASAAWSPDGREIAFVRADSLLVTDVVGRQIRLVATSPSLHSCAWSPGGKWIACVQGAGSFANLAPNAVVLVPAGGGPPIPLVGQQASNQSPVWSPDGGQLLFVSNRDGPRDVYVLALSPSGRPRGQPVRLTTGLGALSISVSADQRRLAYDVYTARANIWSLPIPQGAPITADGAVQVTRGTQVIESMRVSRDGRWLLYDSDLRGNADIYRIPIGGGQPEQLTGDPADEFAPDLSPDGRAVAYHSWRTGTRDIEVKALDGGPVEQVTRTAAQESYPVWSPDGRALAFYDQAPLYGAVFVTRRAARGQWSPPKLMASAAFLPEWSPDGREIAYLTGDSSAQATPLVVMPAEGGRVRRVFDVTPAAPSPEWALWSPDGRLFYYKTHDAQGRASIWAVNAAGGRPRLLVRFTDPDRPSRRPDFATDGKRLFFAIEDRQSDVFVAELLTR
jgi:serine/threonine-protein kinase